MCDEPVQILVPPLFRGLQDLVYRLRASAHRTIDRETGTVVDECRSLAEQIHGRFASCSCRKRSAIASVVCIVVAEIGETIFAGIAKPASQSQPTFPSLLAGRTRPPPRRSSASGSSAKPIAPAVLPPAAATSAVSLRPRASLMTSHVHVPCLAAHSSKSCATNSAYPAAANAPVHIPISMALICSNVLGSSTFSNLFRELSFSAPTGPEEPICL